MKNKLVFSGLVIAGLALTSCNKCAECHYDAPGGIVEIGEYCGDELENIEKDGYTVNGDVYEVHCHDH
jgi:effector-binding domain-containing protein